MTDASNIVYVGRNPPMSYVLAVLTGFSGSKAGEVVLKARGRAITTAVDVAEITRRKFMRELSVGNITVGTEELPQEGGGTRAVSTIEITLKRSISEGKAEKDENAGKAEKDEDEGEEEEK